MDELRKDVNDMTDWDNRLADDGRWQQARGQIRETWGDLTDDDLDRSRGSWDGLVGAIKEKTGEAADAISDKLRSFFR